MGKEITVTERTRVRRGHDRAEFDREVVNSIVDAAPFCTIAYLLDGAPALTPTIHWRNGDRIYWHGSSASRTLRRAAQATVCLNVTLVDGYVLARSAFHHSMNYRSVTIFGTPAIVEDATQKTDALRRMVDHIVPGRWKHLRAMNETELKATRVMWMPIEEASAKVRSGGPVDDDEDYGLNIWAGTVPIRSCFEAPVPDERLKPGIKTPAHVRNRFE